MPQPSRPRFGSLFTEAISSVARRKQVNMEIVEEELAIVISESEGRSKPLAYHTVQRWMRGYPPSCQRMKIIVEFCVRQGRISHDLAESLLRYADCTYLLPILNGLFGQYTAVSPQRTYSILPRPNPDFCGRDREMAELLKRIALESRAAVIVIYGLGGIGKTTLATEAGHACLPGGKANFPVPYERIVFTSARDRTLTLTEVLDEIGRTLDYPDILNRQSVAEKIPLVHNVLSRFQILLIIDNFETIDDPSLTRFAIEGVPAPSKVVITTRDYHPTLWPGTWPIHLQGLDDTDALELVRRWAQDHELEVVLKAKDAELEPLLRTTEGNPYALLTALGLIAHQKRPLTTVLRDLWEGRGEIFEYIFSRSWALLEETERQILLVMPCFAAGATQEAIGVTAGIDGYPLSKGLGQLAKLSLITTDVKPTEQQQRYSMHSLVRSFASNKLEETPKFGEQARARWIRYYLDFAKHHTMRDKPVERYWNALGGGDYTILGPEWPNLLSVLRWVDQNEDNQTLIELTMRLIHYMDLRVLYAERKRYTYRAVEAAHKLEAYIDEALLRIDALGEILIKEGNFAEAESEISMGLHIAEGIKPKNADEMEDINDLIALACAFLTRIYIIRNDITKASESITRAVETSCRPVIKLRVFEVAGQLAYKNQDDDTAIKHFEEAMRVGKQYSSDHEPEITGLYRRLGFAYLQKGDLDRAAAEFNKLLTVKQGHIINAIRAKYGLACVLKAKGELGSAWQFANNALEELSRLDSGNRLLPEIRVFLEAIEAT